MVQYRTNRIPAMIIEEIANRTEYREDGSLIWKFLPRRNDRTGMVAGSISSTDGYVYIKALGKKVSAHRVVFFKHHGFVPREIDHINRVRHDNRIENLREADTHSSNMGNQSHQNGRSSRFKGVCWDKSRGKWAAMIKFKRKNKHLGRFDSETDAALAYNEAAIKLFGEFSHLNEV